MSHSSIHLEATPKCVRVLCMGLYCTRRISSAKYSWVFTHVSFVWKFCSQIILLATAHWDLMHMYLSVEYAHWKTKKKPSCEMQDKGHLMAVLWVTLIHNIKKKKKKTFNQKKKKPLGKELVGWTVSGSFNTLLTIIYTLAIIQWGRFMFQILNKVAYQNQMVYLGFLFP